MYARTRRNSTVVPEKSIGKVKFHLDGNRVNQASGFILVHNTKLSGKRLTSSEPTAHLKNHNFRNGLRPDVEDRL
jgi:hypothetical protein